MKVGVVTYLKARGLGYDAVSLRDAFSTMPGVTASFFPVEDLYRVDRTVRKRKLLPAAVKGEWEWPEAERRRDLATWVAEQDVVFTLEVFLREVAALAFARGIRLVHVPNLEWVSDREGWLTDLRATDVVLAKTRHTERALRGAGLSNVRLVPWSIPLPIEAPRPTGSPIVFFHSAGIGGSHDPKNPEAVLAAFTERFGDRRDVRLVVKTQVPPERRKSPLDLRRCEGAANIRVIAGETCYEAVLSLNRNADVSVFPSRAEGFGLPLLESLTLGVPVITTDGPPMNELVTDGVNGLLVPAEEAGRHRHVPLLEVDRAALGDAMERLLDRELLDRLKAGAATGLGERRAAFRAGLASVLEKTS